MVICRFIECVTCLCFTEGFTVVYYGFYDGHAICRVIHDIQVCTVLRNSCLFVSLFRVFAVGCNRYATPSLMIPCLCI